MKVLRHMLGNRWRKETLGSGGRGQAIDYVGRYVPGFTLGTA